MADNTDREGEQSMFDIILGPDDDQNEEDYDGSEFLNNTGEGDMYSIATTEWMKS